MKLYLVRHGSYTSMDVNISCPLSAEGKADISRLAAYFEKIELSVPAIHHSTKLRAQQTAKILAEVLNKGEAELIEGLEPNDPTQPILKMINTQTEDLMLVGHLPFLAKLSSQLLSIDEDTLLIDFQPGTAVCFSNDTGTWTINWVLNPAMY